MLCVLQLEIGAYCLTLCGLYFGNRHFIAGPASLIYKVVRWRC
jgi:hypothetical protein